ncbi:MAG TPA: PEP-CTERM sorting domain-containing protein [Rhodanobacteraceae bacterium]
MRKHLLGVAIMLAAVAGLWLPQAKADIITFDAQGLTGPSYASQTSAGTISVTTSIGTVTFSGGAILTNASGAPADETSIYYTSYFLDGGINPITITFPTNISNFFLDVYNGQTYVDSFTVADNLGNSQTVSLANNTSGGNALVSFPAAGSIVTISTSDLSGFDFAIDNVGFNQPTPNSVPEPAELGIFGLGLLLIGAFVGLRRRVA